MKIHGADMMDDEFYFVPHHIRGAIEMYILHGISGGSFLNAVLSNDLAGTFGRADSINKKAIGSIVAWVYMYAPSSCWGSKKRVQNWKGLENMKE